MANVNQDLPKGNGIAQHSSASNEHYTPRAIIEVAREAMGSIELDPASCEIANRENVRAKRIFTAADDGLAQSWDAKTIFVNPPGGKLKMVEGRWQPVKHGAAKSSAQVWWQKAIEEWIDDRSKSIVFLGFTLELMRLSQWWAGELDPWHVLAFPFCVLRDRTDFLVEREGKLVEQGDPTHANVLACITSSAAIKSRFIKAAGHSLGAACTPESWNELRIDE